MHSSDELARLNQQLLHQEAQLEQTQQNLFAVLNASPEAIFLMRPDGTVILANQALADRLGRTPAQLQGANLYTFLAPEVAAARRQHVEHVVQAKKPHHFEDKRDERIIQHSLYPVCDTTGEVTHLAVYAQDITARVQAENALLQSQGLLNASQSLNRAGGWEWDVLTRTMTWTDATYRLHGLSPETVEPARCDLVAFSLACYAPESRSTVAAAFHDCVEHGRPYDLRLPFTAADGRQLWVRTMAQAIRENGRVIKVIGNIVDITSYQQMEDLLRARLILSESAGDLSEQELLQRVLDTAETLSGSTMGFFVFYDADDHTLSPQTWSSKTYPMPCSVDDQVIHYPLEAAGVWADAIRLQRPIIHNNYPALPNRKGLPPGHVPLLRELVVPIVRSNRIVAILAIGNKKQPYTQHDVNLVTTLGDIAWDIVMRKRDETALRESEERFRLTFDCAPVGAAMIGPDCRFIRANATLCRFLGYDEQDLLRLGFLDITHPDDREQERKQLHSMLAGTLDRYETEKRYLRQSGEAVWARVAVALSRDQQGCPRFFLPIIQDISARKQAEQRLHEQADFTRRILDSTDAHIAILDEQGVIVDVNSAWIRFARKNGGEGMKCLGVGANYFCPWSAEHGDITAAAEAFAGIRSVQQRALPFFRIEYPCHAPDQIRWFSLHALPLQGSSGHVLVSHTDITPIKETQSQLSAALAEKEVLLREVHHRVKNNLAAIIGLMDMQRRAIDDPHGKTILVELSSRIRSMSLVHEKLYRAKSLARIDFSEYLRALISHLRTSYAANKIICRVESEGLELPLDLAVPCGMIINELVTNALKYAFPDNRPCPGHDTCLIRVDLRRSDTLCTLTVADNGIGLPADLDWTRTRTLGMLLVRMLGQHQLGGQYLLDQSNGTSWTLTFAPEKRMTP
jgi:PAS domain S-box-containing protein